MRGEYLLAYVSAALASVKYRSYRLIYEQSLFIGPWTEMPDGSRLRTGNERWSNSTENARTTLARVVREEAYSWFIPSYLRVSSDCHPVVNGEAPGDIASRVAYAHARDGLIDALQRLAEISLDEGHDPRTSALYASLDLRHELLALLDPPNKDVTPTLDCLPQEFEIDPIKIIRSLYLAGTRKNHGWN